MCLLLSFVQTLSLRQNLIKKIENLDSLSSLRELDLYDNQIRKLENLHHLTELEWVFKPVLIWVLCGCRKSLIWRVCRARCLCKSVCLITGSLMFPLTFWGRWKGWSSWPGWRNFFCFTTKLATLPTWTTSHVWRCSSWAQIASGYSWKGLWGEANAEKKQLY